MAGHPADFEHEDMELLREAARALKAKEGLSQRQLGEALDIAQQNAGLFTRPNSSTGISRKTANRLAVAVGFRDAEELISEGRAMKGIRSVSKGNVWHARDSAVRVAEAMGYTSEAIAAVVAKYTGTQFGKEERKWWLNEIMMEEARQGLEVTRRTRRG
jgi:hypothetical protein